MSSVVCPTRKEEKKNKTSFNVVRLDMLLTSRHLIEFRPGIVILSSDPPARSFSFLFHMQIELRNGKILFSTDAMVLFSPHKYKKMPKRLLLTALTRCR